MYIVSSSVWQVASHLYFRTMYIVETQLCLSLGLGYSFSTISGTRGGLQDLGHDRIGLCPLIQSFSYSWWIFPRRTRILQLLIRLKLQSKWKPRCFVRSGSVVGYSFQRSTWLGWGVYRQRRVLWLLLISFHISWTCVLAPTDLD